MNFVLWDFYGAGHESLPFPRAVTHYKFTFRRNRYNSDILSGRGDKPKRLREDYTAREELRDKLDRYLDLPLALASVVVVLLVLIQLSGDLREPWSGRVEVLSWALWGLFFLEFVAKFALAPVKRRYLRRHWLDVLVVLLPFLKFLRLARVLRATRALPVLRLLIFGGRGSESTLALLKRRRLGQLAIVSAMVVLIGAAAGFLLEADAPGSQIESFGDALWWAAALVTTVGSDLNPVTTGGRIVSFALMLYAIGVFSYFIGSIASVLVESDRKQKQSAEQPRTGVTLDEHELETLRSILNKSEKP